MRLRNEDKKNAGKLSDKLQRDSPEAVCNLTVPDKPYEEQESSSEIMATSSSPGGQPISSGPPPEDLVKGLAPAARHTDAGVGRGFRHSLPGMAAA